MLRARFAFLVLSVILPHVLGAATSPRLATTITAVERRMLEKEARLVFDLLQNHHYSGKALRQVSNQELISNYLDELDPERRFLTNADIDYFNRRFGRSLKSVYLLKGDLQPAFEIYDTFSERLHTRLDWIERRLGNLFDYTLDEIHPPEDTGSSPSTLERWWESTLKSQVLDELLAGRSSPDAREAVAESYRELRRRFAGYRAADVRSHFLDSIIRAFDPHSGYLPANAARDFEIEMGDTLAGIGLDLRIISGRCIVVGLAPGGPADLSALIRPGDQLVAMQNASGGRIDLTDRPFDDIVDAMRGEAGSGLTAYFVRTGHPTELAVSMTRAKVIDPARRARGAISRVPTENGGFARIGWIDLPVFYGSPDAAGESASRDVEELLRAMSARGIEGVVLDLRENPGGALVEAVGLCSLFLPPGRRVLYAGMSGGEPQEHATTDRGFRYDGPLIVLTSPRSASASEVVAGALQLHRRAMIAGWAATFGKGTVQSYLNLDQFAQDSESSTWGSLRLTIEHYFLGDGRPVQQAGIPSDLELPAFEDPGFEREADLPASMAPVALASAATHDSDAPLVGGWNDTLLAHVRSRMTANIETLPEWSLWHDERKAYSDYASTTSRSLNRATREHERDAHLASQVDAARRRQTLARAVAYETDVLETAELDSLATAVREHVRSLVANGTETRGVVVDHDWFAIRDGDGHWRRFHLHQIAFEGAIWFAADLAAQVRSSGYGRPTKEGLWLAFRELAERRRDARADLRDRLVAALEPVSQEVADEALAVFFASLLEHHPQWLDERPLLDVSLREALRAAAAWHHLASELSAPAQAP